MTFTTSLGATAKFITIGITIGFALLLSSMLAGYFLLINDAGKSSLFLSSIVLIIIYFGAYFFRPLHYEITKDQVIIHRPLKNVVFNKEDLKSVELVDKGIMKLTIRTFGVGGLFGYYGTFANWKIGKMTWYATRRDKGVLLRTINDKKILVTPDEPEDFIKQFNS